MNPILASLVSWLHQGKFAPVNTYAGWCQRQGCDSPHYRLTQLALLEFGLAQAIEPPTSASHTSPLTLWQRRLLAGLRKQVSAQRDVHACTLLRHHHASLLTTAAGAERLTQGILWDLSRPDHLTLRVKAQHYEALLVGWGILGMMAGWHLIKTAGMGGCRPQTAVTDHLADTLLPRLVELDAQRCQTSAQK